MQRFEEIPMENIAMMKGVHCAFISGLNTIISFIEMWALFHSAKMGECCWIRMSEGDASPALRYTGHLFYKPGIMLRIEVAAYAVCLSSRRDGEDGGDAALIVQIRPMNHKH